MLGEDDEMVSKISEHVENVPRTISMLNRGGEGKSKQQQHVCLL